MGKKEIEAYPDITGQAPNAFAHFTIQKRLPKILDQILAQNNLEVETIKSLRGLRHEISEGVVKPFTPLFADREYWLDFLKLYTGKGWLEVPFYLIEAYFYRRIIAATGFFMNGLDPFRYTKNAEISRNASFFEQALKDDRLARHNASWIEGLKRLLLLNLWGNQSDLSQVQNGRGDGLAALQEISSEHLLIDHTDAIASRFTSTLDRVDLVLDNAGMELFVDLLLADYLLSQGLAQKVHLHAKACPTFVSDATLQDVNFLLGFLGRLPDAMPLEGRLQGYLQRGQLLLKAHRFWNAPLHFYDMPRDLHGELVFSDLIVFKGDANYRRLLGDKQLPVNLPASEMTDYLPAPSISIRTLKSELIVGLDKCQAGQLDADDPDWKTNGDYGVIQAFGRWS